MAKSFSQPGYLSLVEAWFASLAYTFQLYNDFSGYTDMAIGVALFFNIHLPKNFSSPYLSLNIQDFWRRWHMTLSRFLRDYIYIPLGGGRSGQLTTYRNLMITFLVGGIWHGAGWGFLFWGTLHGVALVIHRVWRRSGVYLNKYLSWLLTFGFVNICWVYFRAESIDDAHRILTSMFNFTKFDSSELYLLISDITNVSELKIAYRIVFLLLLLLFSIDSSMYLRKLNKKIRFIFIVLFFNIGMYKLLTSMHSEFLYYDF